MNWRERLRYFNRDKNPEMYDKLCAIGCEIRELGWNGQVNIGTAEVDPANATAFVYPEGILGQLIDAADTFGVVEVAKFDVRVFRHASPLRAAEMALDFVKSQNNP
jgi:hypothetical protein